MTTLAKTLIPALLALTVTACGDPAPPATSAAQAVVSPPAVTPKTAPPAAPFTYEQGAALFAEIEKALENNRSELRKDESTYPARSKYMDDLAARAEKLYGVVLESEYGQCTKAAIDARHIWYELASLKRTESQGRAIKIEPTITAIVDYAFEGGQSYWECYLKMDALNPANQQ
jgi:hypothetical protein